VSDTTVPALSRADDDVVERATNQIQSRVVSPREEEIISSWRVI
jgi:hypothetical protein